MLLLLLQLLLLLLLLTISLNIHHTKKMSELKFSKYPRVVVLTRHMSPIEI